MRRSIVCDTQGVEAQRFSTVAKYHLWFSVSLLIWAILAAGTHRVNADKELLTQHGLGYSKAPQNCFGDA